MRMLSGHWGVVLIGALVLVMVITMGLQLIPFLGPLAQPPITTLLYAGLVKLFHRIATDGRSDFGDLFAGFSERKYRAPCCCWRWCRSASTWARCW